jgi:AcrR family transcriptional regulator
VSKQLADTQSEGSARGARKTRSARGQNTEDELIRIATQLFCARGYNATSIAELADAMGVTNASVYYYVSSKQELLLRVLQSGLDGFLSQLEEIAARDVPSREKLRLAIENHLAFVFGRRDAITVFLRERRFLDSPYREEYQRNVHRYDELFVGIIKDGVASGELPPVDPQVTSLLVLGALNWIVEWHKQDGRLGHAQLTEIIVDLLLARMLAVPADAR